MSVAQFSPRMQEEPLMPLTPREQVRQSIIRRNVSAIAELLVEADKAIPGFKLADLRSEEARRVYLAEAEMMLGAESRHERASRVHANDAHYSAIRHKDQADVEWQARQDIVRFGHRTDTPRFGVIRPGHCYVCRERVVSNKAVVMITENLQAEAHGTCCAKDEQRFEVADQHGFAYRVKGGRS